MRYLLILLTFAVSNLYLAQNNTGVITGKATIEPSGEPLSDCNISVSGKAVGAVSDKQGNFRLVLPFGTYEIKFSYLGLKTVIEKVELNSASPNLTLNVKMTQQTLEKEEVTVIGNREVSPVLAQKLEKMHIRRMPTLYSDVMRTVQIMPGVTSNNELSSSYNVRGGNFDENLVYLNGYEIYRPFLLRQGVEENQTLVNQDMVQGLRFFNGAFPAYLGDKMSSALEVNYIKEQTDSISGSLRADLLNMGAYLGHHIGEFSVSGAFRYAYPGRFLKGLHTKGSYYPSFTDIQLLAFYKLSNKSNVELFFLNALNKYNLIPSNWDGHFMTSREDVKQVTLQYDGKKEYAFHTNLAGLKYEFYPDNKTYLNLAAARYDTKENENTTLSTGIFFSPDANSPDNEKEFLKSRFEFADNQVILQTYEGQLNFSKTYGIHTVQTGLNYRKVKLDYKKNESLAEKSDSNLVEVPQSDLYKDNMDLNSLSGYILDNISLSNNLQLNAGFRYNRYFFNDEDLFSPRLSINYYPSSRHLLTLSWGYYYQPPFFHELKGKDNITARSIRSQKAVHYVLGWEYYFKEKVKFQATAYYKDLDRLIPYYMEQLKIEYLNNNNYEGYARGIDLQFQGEFSQRIKSWVSYSYLDTKERLKGTKPYQRRLLDQTHTLQVFLQDKMPKHPNWQSHLRLVFGSGFLYHTRRKVTDEVTGKQYIAVSFDRRDEFPFYMRADMGLSVSHDFKGKKRIVVIAEVQNIFDKRNIAGYSWIQAFSHIRQPIEIAQIYSKRFFNLRCEFSF